MKVIGKQSVEIELDDAEARRFVCEYLCKYFGWQNGYFIEDDNVREMVEYATSHTWSEKETVRKATQVDKALQTILKGLSYKKGAQASTV
jgi:hypothetical protein